MKNLVITVLFIGLGFVVGFAVSSYKAPAPVNEKVAEVQEAVEKDEPIVPENVDLVTEVPIIMYHYVREVDKTADPLGWNLSINPADFEKQLQYLQKQGYVGIHLADLLDKKVPEKAVVLTFDDGLEDFYTTALPLLQKYGFTASNAIITGMVGGHEHMTKDQIEAIIEAGIEITSHTISHPDLAASSEEFVREQVTDSKNFLKEEFGVDVSGFVYPAGKYNDTVVRVLEESAYQIAVTTEYGEADLANDKMLLLPRIRIDNRDGFEGFVTKLEALE